VTNLLDQRCLNHALREAAVQCPSCKRFFCRECVTEHAGRMICVGCVSVLARGEEKTARAARLRWAMTALFGILIAWLVFYYLGLTLARIPSEFHSASKSVGRDDPRKPGLTSLSQGATSTRASAPYPVAAWTERSVPAFAPSTLSLDGVPADLSDPRPQGATIV
jgi:hypothetical protein